MMSRIKIWTVGLVLLALAIAPVVAGCSTPSADGPAAGANGVSQTASAPATENTSGFRADLATNPSTPLAGSETELVFTVKDPSGATIQDLAIVHEKPMHLIVVSADLAEFYHIHPAVQADGTFRVTENFPHGGEYTLYADFTPKGAKQVIEKKTITVQGTVRDRVPLVADTMSTRTADGIAVTMKPSAPLVSGRDLLLNFSVRDEKTGVPVTDLEKYLGEFAHFVIISEDGADFLHAHPMSGGGSTKGTDHSKTAGAHPHSQGAESAGHEHAHGDGGHESPSAVSAHTNFPRTGLYKVWAQFQRHGRVIAVPFVVTVHAGSAASATTVVPVDAVKVSVTVDGYEPSRITVRKGEPVRLAFTRVDAKSCGGKVVIPKLGIERDLPVGQTVLVEFTPREPGDISFQCGMGMLSGTVVVE